MTIDALFRPLAIRGLSLANRIVMAPMTRSFSPAGEAGLDLAGRAKKVTGATKIRHGRTGDLMNFDAAALSVLS